MLAKGLTPILNVVSVTSSEPSEPTDSDIVAIRALVAELVRRAPAAGEV
jgi:hypothetical protein